MAEDCCCWSDCWRTGPALSLDEERLLRWECPAGLFFMGDPNGDAPALKSIVTQGKRGRAKVSFSQQ